MNRETVEEIYNRISRSLQQNKTKATKTFWYGFLVGLTDYGGLSETDYKILRNRVEQT